MGTSIHTTPVVDQMMRRLTRDVMEQATCNFFVAEPLVDLAKDLLCPHFRHEVLCNGAGEAFERYPDARRAALRKEYGVEQTKVVSFAARFEKEKNVLLLPDIFHAIKAKCQANMAFWAFGEGSLRSQVEKAMADKGINCHFWGNLPPTSMPLYLNCTDLLVLPSQKEALPLIILESLSCGANVVSSDVMGMASVVGHDNVVDITDSQFVEKFSQRAAEMLTTEVVQTLPPAYSWLATAKKEYEIYNKY